MAAPVFEMENVTVRRNEREILKDINWTVERDQHWVVLGGNGSGKTSMLNVLMGYLTPTEGDCHMRARECGQLEDPELGRLAQADRLRKQQYFSVDRPGGNCHRHRPRRPACHGQLLAEDR